jgi:hypothetical protein
LKIEDSHNFYIRWFGAIRRDNFRGLIVFTGGPGITAKRKNVFDDSSPKIWKAVKNQDDNWYIGWGVVGSFWLAV